MEKQSKVALKVSKVPKGQNPFKPTIFANKNKDFKCKEYGGIGHFQAECANTLKKKETMAIS